MTSLAAYTRKIGSRAFDLAGNTFLKPPLSGFNQVVCHGPRDAARPKVALTVDDGPLSPTTDQLLDLFGELKIKATFFLIGENAQHFPDLVRRTIAEGHVIGNHSQSHRRSGSILPTNQGEHIDASAEILSTFLDGKNPALYRAPWGWVTPWEIARLRQRHQTIIGWDVATNDWLLPQPPGEELAAKIISEVKPGSIVLMHDGIGVYRDASRPETIKAVKLLVPRLQAAGFEFVTIPEMLGVPAYR